MGKRPGRSMMEPVVSNLRNMTSLRVQLRKQIIRERQSRWRQKAGMRLLFINQTLPLLTRQQRALFSTAISTLLWMPTGQTSSFSMVYFRPQWFTAQSRISQNGPSPSRRNRHLPRASGTRNTLQC